MRNELEQFARGEVAPSRQNRLVAREAKAVYDRARMKALEVDSKLAVAAHTMEGITKLDRHRKALCSPEDETLHNLLFQIELETFEQVRTIACGPRQTNASTWLF